MNEEKIKANREKSAAYYRKITESQHAITLEQFLAQGQKRSRQKR